MSSKFRFGPRLISVLLSTAFIGGLLFDTNKITNTVPATALIFWADNNHIYNVNFKCVALFYIGLTFDILSLANY